MSWFSRAFSSTIGLKVMMALTGLMMVGFLVGHLAGNLLIFVGPEAINDYAKALHGLPAVVWGTRIAMLVAIAIHIHAAKTLTKRNRQASPQKYAVSDPLAATLASRTMFPGGLFLFIYILYHLAHYTLKWTHPEFALLENGDVYGMMVISFSTLWLSIFYVVAMIALSLHLMHGFRSAFQTLGINHLKYQSIIKASGPLVGTIIPLGFASIPVAVLLGIIR